MSIVEGAAMFVLKDHKVDLSCLAFSPDGARLAACGRGGVVQLWDLASRKLIRKLGIGWAHEVVCFTPDGHGLLVLDAGILTLWDLNTGKLVGRRPRGNRRATRSVAFSPDGRRACLHLPGRHGWVLEQYTFPDFAPSWKQSEGPGYQVTAMAYSHDGERLACGGWNGSLVVLDAATGAVRDRLGEPGTPSLAAVALSPDGRTIAWVAATRLHVWRLEPAEPINHHTLGRTFFFAVAFHPSGGFFATANGDGKVDTWDARTGEHRQAFDWKVGKLHDVVFDATGDRAACCGKSGQIVVWDVDR